MKKDKELGDYIIQLNSIVDNSLIELKKKFINNTSHKDYKILFRSFLPIFKIFNFKDKINKLFPEDCILLENYGIDSPSELSTLFRNEGKKFSYKTEFDFMLNIKDIPLEKEFNSYYINNIKKDNLLFFFKNYDIINENFSSFVDNLISKYPENFISFSKDDSLNFLRKILLMGFLREERNKNINKYVLDNYVDDLHIFSNELSAKLYQIVKWKNLEEDKWYENLNIKINNSSLPNDLIFFKGIEKIVMAEIVPKGLNSYIGEIGGKPIKIANYNDLNEEFLKTIAYSLPKEMLFDEHLNNDLRVFFTKFLIARRYVFSEAINNLIALSEDKYKVNFSKISTNTNFRKFIYNEFYDMSNGMLSDRFRYVNNFYDN